MQEDLGLVAQLTFWIAVLVALAAGGAIGAWKRFSVGGAVTGLLMGVLGLAGAGYALHAYWQFWREPGTAQATVVSADTPPGASRRALVVRFTTREGRVVETGDTGPVPETSAGVPHAGETIGVRYGADPSRVTLHVVKGWLIGGVVFGMFSTFALLTGLFFVAQIADERARPTPAVTAETTAGSRATIARTLTIVSNVAFLGAFAWMMFGRGSALQTFGTSLRVIAFAGVGYALAGLLTPGGPWTAVMIPLIVGIMCGLFGVFILIVG
jgi:hypothetical protein